MATLFEHWSKSSNASRVCFGRQVFSFSRCANCRGCIGFLTVNVSFSTAFRNQDVNEHSIPRTRELLTRAGPSSAPLPDQNLMFGTLKGHCYDERGVARPSRLQGAPVESQPPPRLSSVVTRRGGNGHATLRRPCAQYRHR
ncbi:hypothetical protein C8Q70DRAFT_388396 [Cubamyces menziesii]|nr:hypothetical protein C8Q70DRAFT_388396 [Cubamyces menziesii]